MLPKFCLKLFIRAFIFIGMGATITQARADVLLDEYVAELSRKDHFNSSGERLDSAAAIIRQDRANFHRYGRADQGDTNDEYFNSAKNRGLLERLIARGTIDVEAEHFVLRGRKEIS